MEEKNNTETFYTRKFEKLQDFNLIYITNFEKLNLPMVITGNFLKRYPQKISATKFIFWSKLIDNPELPSEVIEGFNLSNVVVHNGIVYKKSESDGEIFYDSFADATEKIKEVLNLPEIYDSIESLSNATRKPVLSRDLLSLPGFNLIENEALGDISLSIKDDVTVDRNTRSCKITLNVVKDSLLISLDIGVLNYSVYRTR